MDDKPADVLAAIIKLAKTLPTSPAEYGVISAPKRNKLRAELESVVMQLNDIAHSLDPIRQPKHTFDPTSPKVIGEMVAHTLLLQEKEPLSAAVAPPFYGAGVYAIYYHGGFPCYVPISGKDHPIYVGKADPAALHALTPREQGDRLCVRLKDHIRSLTSAENLDLSDFACRYLVVRSAWVETAEDLLINWFNPVWNNETKVCYGFGKHGDSASTRSNERSPWDTLHPGRAWATSAKNTPNKKTVAQVREAIAEHFKKHPPKSGTS